LGALDCQGYQVHDDPEIFLNLFVFDLTLKNRLICELGAGLDPWHKLFCGKTAIKLPPLAVVTGASSRIGHNLAKCCAENGFDLLVAAGQRRKLAEPGTAEKA